MRIFKEKGAAITHEQHCASKNMHAVLKEILAMQIAS